MKKRLQGLIAGILIGVLSVSSIVGAKELSENVQVFYNNIKIFIDGAEIVPKDATGNTVEPFIYNGTTYLPVRAVANAFNKDVMWDGATSSVYIGKTDETKPDNYLHKIQYNSYQEGHDDNDFVIINGTVTDYRKNEYTNGLLFYMFKNWYIADDEDEAQIIINYPLNSQYNNLKGKIVLPKSFKDAVWENGNCESKTVDVYFYGDGTLLHKATNVTSSMPFDFDIDIKGTNQLTIKFFCEEHYTYVALTDLALYK